MDDLTLQHEPQQTRMVSGALIEQVIGVVRVGFEQQQMRMVSSALNHLARHMQTGCPRAAYLAAMLLEQVSSDPAADAHLREHARELVEMLERDPVNKQAADAATTAQSSSPADRSFVSEW